MNTQVSQTTTIPWTRNLDTIPGRMDRYTPAWLTSDHPLDQESGYHSRYNGLIHASLVDL